VNGVRGPKRGSTGRPADAGNGGGPGAVDPAAVTFEGLRGDHLPALLALETELFGAEAWSEGMLRSELAQPDDRYYRVALAAGRVVGYAGLGVFGDEAHVLTVGVLQQWQGRGLGASLLRALLTEAERRQLFRMLLEVRADNLTAQRLYERHGFRSVGRRPRYYQPSGTDAVVMARG